MIRRASACALVLALLVLVGPPAAAKGPTQVEIHDLRSGTTIQLGILDHREMHALGVIVDWPDARREPRGLRTGRLVHIATLTWQLDDDTPFWVDRVYSDDAGIAWVGRRDHAAGSTTVAWRRISAFAFTAVLAAIETPAKPVISQSPLAAAVLDATPRPSPSGTGDFDAASFGWGVGLAGVLTAGSFLVMRRRSRPPSAAQV